jgi:hypothetical protein
MGFLLSQGSTYNGYTCPSAATSPCFVQYGDSVPTTGGGGGSDVNISEIGGNAVTTTLPVSGTVIATQTTASNLNATVVGTGTFAVQPTTAVNSLGITPTDRTITSASGASQQIMAANSSRHSLLIQNTGNANCGVNPIGGTAAIGGAGTLTLLPNSSYSPRIPTLSAITIICNAGQPIYGNEN